MFYGCWQGGGCRQIRICGWQILPKAALKGKLTPAGVPSLEASISPSLQPLRAAVGFLRQVRTSCVQASGQKQLARRARNLSATGSSRRRADARPSGREGGLLSHKGKGGARRGKRLAGPLRPLPANFCFPLFQRKRPVGRTCTGLAYAHSVFTLTLQ